MTPPSAPGTLRVEDEWEHSACVEAEADVRWDGSEHYPVVYVTVSTPGWAARATLELPEARAVADELETAITVAVADAQAAADELEGSA